MGVSIGGSTLIYNLQSIMSCHVTFVFIHLMTLPQLFFNPYSFYCVGVEDSAFYVYFFFPVCYSKCHGLAMKHAAISAYLVGFH